MSTTKATEYQKLAVSIGEMHSAITNQGFSSADATYLVGAMLSGSSVYVPFQNFTTPQPPTSH